MKNLLLEAVRLVSDLETRDREQAELIDTLKEINAQLLEENSALGSQVKKLQEVQQLRLMQVLDESDERKLQKKTPDVEKKLLDLVHPVSPDMSFLNELQEILTMQATAVKFRMRADITAYYREIGSRIIRSALKRTRE